MLINTSYFLQQPTQLIQASINGDRQSQSQLYALLVAKMFAVCLRYCKNREEAEEIVQEGFVQVFKSLKNFKHQGSFEGWVRKIMVYCAIQHYRSNIKMFPVISIDSITNSIEEQTGTDEIVAQLGKKELLQMVQALPPAYRMVFNLYVFEGMKHREQQFCCLRHFVLNSLVQHHKARRDVQFESPLPALGRSEEHTSELQSPC